MKTRFALQAGCLLFVAPTLVFSAELVLPRGTVVFGELEERITSNAKSSEWGTRSTATFGRTSSSTATS